MKELIGKAIIISLVVGTFSTMFLAIGTYIYLTVNEYWFKRLSDENNVREHISLNKLSDDFLRELDDYKNEIEE